MLRLLRTPICRKAGCRHLEAAKALAEKYSGRADAVSVDVANENELDALVAEHDIVISLIPYIHHAAVIKSAIRQKKHVVTTSYISPAMVELDAAAKEAGITVMNEIGLDPGLGIPLSSPPTSLA
ncbi:MAG: Saccharopine dehydrogenase-domain-containing protein [Olpidium bornovanus]|uniref:Saccharopine dehydrogenase-domain-containing protein n=1 Tax=Olpidium bornovanus TaxID=278681 RepID=A0A8H8DJM7_9FUNG|nr:MAG: Saccharopine dehydrogenase-domain-containing protein [Olpidium bornovanus]